MNSPFANIYQAIIAQIQTITITRNGQSIPFPYIDLDYGQLESKERPEVDFPCALIDFKDWQFQNTGAFVQLAQGIICIKLATDPYDATSSITPGGTIQAGIAILDLEYQLYQTLQGFKAITEYDDDNNPTHGTTPFIREHITTDDRRPGLKVRHLYFSTSFTDYSAATLITTTTTTPNITASFNIPS